jgi:D-alanine--poly(phosphoribitol) ligase subunit 1
MGAIGRATLPTQGSVDLLGLVLRHAHDRPLQLALKDDNESFNYAQLAERVASVAAGLAALGVSPGDRVALQLGNSAAFVTSALGCLWAGTPFVPLPVDSPAARLASLIEDCDPALIVTRDKDTPGLTSPGRRTSTVEDVLEVASKPPERSANSERDAYVLFTSGTTGKPKGVRIPEKALVRAVCGARDALGLDETTRGLAVSSFHFDGSYATVFPPLVAGGSLVIPRREDLLFLKRFYQVVLDEAITYASFSPSYLRLVLASRRFESLAGCQLQTLALGGEECLATDLAKVWSVLPDVKIFNRYGPTETTIAVTNYQVAPRDVASGVIPIGVPHPGTEFFLLSEEGKIIEGNEEPGELYIGGDQLMRGYWSDKSLSDKVLRQDVVPGRVLYKTGDLVYRDERGLYVYTGRLDDVIKRNGVRISLAEVARAFRGTEGVRGAFCALVDQGGLPGIVAFVEAGAQLTTASLIESAREQLPSTMLPDEVFIVASLPMTSQGKVDRRQLLSDFGRTGWQEGRVL